MTTLPSLAGALALTVALAAPASAHVVLDKAEAPAGSYVRLAFQVGHGCGGAATTGLRVTLPPGLGAARPMPHAGWSLSVSGGAEDHSAHAGHGGAHAAHHGAAPQAPAPEAHARHAAPTPGEIAWTGGRLDDAHYDEFVVLIRTPAEPGTVLAFPVTQECEGGAVARWADQPSRPGERVANPVPRLRLVPRP